MTEPQDDPTGPDQQGSQAQQHAEPQGQVPDGDQGSSPGEQLARKLLVDVAAFEVDPPPPARVDQTPRDADPSSPAE